MRVGIIGFKGFVGSAFYDVFSADKGCKVTGVSKKNYESLIGQTFDLLINANGNSSKPLADREPMKDLEMNLVNTIRFLNDFKFGCFLHVSTVEIYPDKSHEKNTREDLLINPVGLSNYGFSKYLSEQAVMRYAKNWLVIRLAGMFGKNMKKGPAYDILEEGKLFISGRSELPFIETAEVARIAKGLIERQRFNRIYNIVGKGSIQLSQFARLANVKLSSEGEETRTLRVSTEKLERETGLPSTIDSIKQFLSKHM